MIICLKIISILGIENSKLLQMLWNIRVRRTFWNIVATCRINTNSRQCIHAAICWISNVLKKFEFLQKNKLIIIMIIETLTYSLKKCTNYTTNMFVFLVPYDDMSTIARTLRCQVSQTVDIKDARSYFQKFSFLFHLKNHLSKDVNFKFQLKRSSLLDVRSNFVYCSFPYLTV